MSLTIFKLNKIEFVCVLATFVSLFYIVIWNSRHHISEPVVLMDQMNINHPILEYAQNFRVPNSYDFYKNQSTFRDPFSIANAKDLSEPVGQLPANLKVTGILTGSSPEVVLEDSSTNQVYFVNERSTDGISISEVQQDKILLNYHGQIVEVKMKGSLKDEANQ